MNKYIIDYNANDKEIEQGCHYIVVQTKECTYFVLFSYI